MILFITGHQNYSKHTFLTRKTSRFCYLLRSVIMDDIRQRYLICRPLVVYQVYCMSLYHSKTRHHLIIKK